MTYGIGIETMMKHFTIILAFLITLSSPVAAQDFDKGMAALEVGDYETALIQLRPLAEQGNNEAQFILGQFYFDYANPLDMKEAEKWFKLSASQGNNEAQFMLGQFYMDYANPMDIKEAAKWFKLSASQGNGLAQFKLCGHYGLGLGVLEDNVMAHMWCNIASANPKSNTDVSALSRKNKRIFAKEMTKEDISIAQAMARECMSSNYKKCGY